MGLLANAGRLLGLTIFDNFFKMLIQFNCKCPYMFNWSQYINITKNKQPRSLLLQTLGYVKNKGAN